MSNVLPWEKRVRVLAALVEGNSERAVGRMVKVSRPTVSRFAMALGQGAVRLHNRLVRGLACADIIVDETWSYCLVKEARTQPKHGPDAGDEYTFVALDKVSRLAVSFIVGKRTQATTDTFVADVRSRVTVMPGMTSDGFAPYVPAIGSSFGPSIDYAQTVKNDSGRRRRAALPEEVRGPFITKRCVYGAPDLGRASTAYIERQNCTMRHHIGRTRRRCLAFSKRLDHHRAAAALGYCFYNLGLVVRTLGKTPAMAAGLTDHVWGVEEFMDVVLAEPDGAAPLTGPLAYRTPAVPHRELPSGRGFLRLFQGEDTPVKPKAANDTARPAPPPKLTPRVAIQLDLFDGPPS